MLRPDLTHFYQITQKVFTALASGYWVSTVFIRDIFPQLHFAHSSSAGWGTSLKPWCSLRCLPALSPRYEILKAHVLHTLPCVHHRLHLLVHLQKISKNWRLLIEHAPSLGRNILTGKWNVKWLKNNRDCLFVTSSCLSFHFPEVPLNMGQEFSIFFPWQRQAGVNMDSLSTRHGFTYCIRALQTEPLLSTQTYYFKNVV